MPPNGKGKTHIYKATNVFGEFQPLESRSGKFQVLERRLDALDASDLFDEVAVRLGAPVGHPCEPEVYIYGPDEVNMKTSQKDRGGIIFRGYVGFWEVGLRWWWNYVRFANLVFKRPCDIPAARLQKNLFAWEMDKYWTKK